MERLVGENPDLLPGALVCYFFKSDGGINADGTDVFDRSTPATHQARQGSTAVFTESEYAQIPNYNIWASTDCSQMTVMVKVEINADTSGIAIAMGDYFLNRRCFDVRFTSGKLRSSISDDGNWTSNAMYYEADDAVSTGSFIWVGFRFNAGIFKLLVDSNFDVDTTDLLTSTITSINNNVTDPVTFTTTRRNGAWETSSTLRLAAGLSKAIIFPRYITDAELTNIQESGIIPSDATCALDFSEESGTDLYNMVNDNGSYTTSAVHTTDNDIGYSLINKYGFNIDGSVIIPASLTDRTTDADGTILANVGKARFDAVVASTMGSDYTGGFVDAHGDMTLPTTPETTRILSLLSLTNGFTRAELLAALNDYASANGTTELIDIKMSLEAILGG